MNRLRAKRIYRIAVLSVILAVISALTAYAVVTFSSAWSQDASGKWHIYQTVSSESRLIKNAWICDDALPQTDRTSGI